MQALAVVSMLLGLCSTVYWMVLGVRAVRAHEAIADRIGLLARAQIENRGTGAPEQR